MSALAPRPNKILRLPRRGQARQEARPSVMALKVRGHLSLLQGYADIMEGVSPQLRAIILQVMAGKNREAGTRLQPLSGKAPPPLTPNRPMPRPPPPVVLGHPLLPVSPPHNTRGARRH